MLSSRADVVHDVAEFMEESHHVTVRKKGRSVFRRLREVANTGSYRNLFGVGEMLALQGSA